MNGYEHCMEQGEACMQGGRASEACAWFAQAASERPDAFPAHTRLGLAHMQCGDYERAIEAFECALVLRPGAPVVTLRMGQCYAASNRLQAAIRFLGQAVELQPMSVEAWVELGNALQKQGRVDEGLECQRQALRLDPGNAVAVHNMGLCLYNDRDLRPAEQAFRKALEMAPDSELTACFLGIVLEHQGKSAEAGPVLERACRHSAFNRCLVDSVRYALGQAGDARFFSNTADLLRDAVSQARLDGLFMEFGVYHGNSLAIIADCTDSLVHGFDSFEGLPEGWFVGEGKAVSLEEGGAYSTGGRIPDTPANTRLHRGWFQDSLPPFLEANPGPAAFINIDCDLYSSTRMVFKHLAERIGPGAVIVFDEYFCYPRWREHEYRAFQEFIAQTGLKYEYLSFSYFTAQAAIRITEGG
ncbi:MAG TPA: tetratricopeptide repeat protein [Methylothermaceae bacterium]|nr:tetratricopeptide repeat protein [Methylothermaceae bacterium]